MKVKTPRLRMFAGPNGSGKSTLYSVINPILIGVYVNPDEIEKQIHKRGYLDLSSYQVKTTAKDILDFFAGSTLLKNANLLDQLNFIRFSDQKCYFDLEINAYFAAVIADYIRHKLLEQKEAFTFETVMSSSDKIDFLKLAQSQGYRTYLYYVATENPAINISRVKNRVEMGGHPVPEDKIVSRYSRSLDLLFDAVQYTNRAYIFDNSGHEKVWIAEITDGCLLEIKSDQMPRWFKTALLDKFKAKSS